MKRSITQLLLLTAPNQNHSILKLRRLSRTEVLARSGLVYSNTSFMDQDEGMTKPQNAWGLESIVQ